MFHRPITFHDLDGNEITEEYHFGLNEAEIVEIDLGTGVNGLTEYVKAIIAAKNSGDLIKVIQDLILKSYGVRGADGKQFVKIDPATGQPLATAFKQTEAYSNLFMELAQDDVKAAEFVKGIMPAKYSDKIKDLDLKAEAEKILG